MRHTPEEIIAKLAEAKALREKGVSVAQLVIHLGVSQPTYNRWLRRYRDIALVSRAEMEALERENGLLKALVAEQALRIAAFHDKGSGARDL